MRDSGPRALSVDTPGPGLGYRALEKGLLFLVLFRRFHYEAQKGLQKKKKKKKTDNTHTPTTKLTNAN